LAEKKVQNIFLAPPSVARQALVPHHLFVPLQVMMHLPQQLLAVFDFCLASQTHSTSHAKHNGFNVSRGRRPGNII